jgi:hypothetical protein
MKPVPTRCPFRISAAHQVAMEPCDATGRRSIGGHPPRARTWRLAEEKSGQSSLKRRGHLPLSRTPGRRRLIYQPLLGGIKPYFNPHELAANLSKQVQEMNFVRQHAFDLAFNPADVPQDRFNASFLTLLI